jgi:hypothetical protein
MPTSAHAPRRPEAPNARDAEGPADPEQYARFLEVARELGCEEGMDRLDDALRRVAKAGPHPRPDAPRPKKEGGT